MSRPTSRLNTERDLPARAGWVSAVVAVILGALLVTQCFLAQATFWEIKVPVWVTVAILGTGAIFFCWKFALARAWQPRRAFGLLGLVLFSPVLVVMLWKFTFVQEPETPQILFAVLWALCFSSVSFDFFPQLLANTRRWRQAVAAALIMTGCWAALVRLALVGDSEFFLVVIASALWLCIFRWLPFQSSGRRESNFRVAWLVGLGVVIIWGSWIRLANVDSFAFQGDEYFHLNTAMGYLQSGEYVQWDYLNLEPQWEKPYPRAWIYTWQVAQSINFFGLSEWSVRLPAVVWGIVLLLLLPLLVIILTRSYSMAFFATAFTAFDPTFVWLSTFSRMYTFLAVLTVLSIGLFCLTSTLFRSKDRLRWIALGACLSIAAGTGIFVHEVAFLLPAGFLLALVLLAISFPQDRWYRRAAGALGFVLAAGAVTAVFLPIFQWTFITIRFVPAWEYLQYFVSSLTLPVVGFLLLFGLIFFQKKWSVLVLTIIGIVAPIVIYFFLFADRYSAKKYSSFIIPFVYLLMAYLWVSFGHKAFTKEWTRFVLGGVLSIFLLVPVSIPGAEAVPFMKQDRSTLSYRQIGFHDYPGVYEYLEREAGFGDAVVLQGTKHYYLHRPDLVYFSTSRKNTIDREAMKQIVGEHEHGWVVLSRVKMGKLPIKFRRYVDVNLTEVAELRQTNFRVYRW